MIHSFEGLSANDVWSSAASYFQNDKTIPIQKGRGGSTRELLRVSFLINDPRQRWVICREPPINPAFALAEIIWIMNGRNEAAYLNYWNTQLPQFAGSGETYHGAYGYRLRFQFNIDQILRAYQTFKNNPESRQVVLQIWNAEIDLPSKDGSPVNPDIPCNIISLLLVRDRKLEWTQIMRSNDFFLGTPHNFIQFTTLQEIIAGWLNLELGSYYHLSNSLHVYQDRPGSDLNFARIKVTPNLDFLGISKEDSDKIFKELYFLTNKLTLPDLTPEELISIVRNTDLPKAYRNMLIIVAAESARRRGLLEVSQTLTANCTNPIFLQAWGRWMERMSGDSQ